MEQRVPQGINITLSSIESKLVRFNFTDYSNTIQNVLQQEKYEFNFKMNLTLTPPPAKLIAITFDTMLQEKANENKKIELAELVSKHTFKIANYEQVIRLNDKKEMLIPDKLFSICSTIAISEIRGMFSIKLDGTTFSNAVVPLMDGDLFIPPKK